MQLLSFCTNHTEENIWAWGSTSPSLPATGHRGHAPNPSYSQQTPATAKRTRLLPTTAVQSNSDNMEFLAAYRDYLDTKITTKIQKLLHKLFLTSFVEVNTYEIIKEGKVCCSCTLQSAILFFKHF